MNTDINFHLPDAARLALSLVINVEEGAEMSPADGDKKPEPVDELGIVLKASVRNYGNESNYRYGINAGAPRVQKLLLKYGFKATWTAAALAFERAPQLARWVSENGHEVCSHGYRWVHQLGFSEAQEREFIHKAIKSFEQTCGQRPVGWLSRYLHTDITRRLLVEAGFLYHMDDYADDVPRREWIDCADGSQKPIVVVPYALDTNDMKFWLNPAYTPQMWLDYNIATFDQLYEEGRDQPKIMSTGLHLRIIGRPGRIGVLDRFMRYVAAKPHVWITTRRAIAERFIELNPEKIVNASGH